MMAETYSVLVPNISTATLSPNPVAINGKVILMIKVTEEIVVLEPDKIYSGEIFSGEA